MTLIKKVASSVIAAFRAIAHFLQKLCCSASLRAGPALNQRNNFPLPWASAHPRTESAHQARVKQSELTKQPLALEDIPRNIYQGLEINRAVLQRIPEKISTEQLEHIARAVQPPIELNELLTQFDKVFEQVPADRVICSDDTNITLNKFNSREALNNRYLNFIQNPSRETYGGESATKKKYKETVAASLAPLMKGIIFELRKNEIPLEKKEEALKDLVRSAAHCAPRRYEEVKKTYLTLSNQMETLDNIVLGYIQQSKEDLFTQFYTHSNEPVMTLNYIRSQVGEELGLDCDPINLQDIHMATHHNARFQTVSGALVQHETREHFLRVFRNIYTPERILFLMMGHLNRRISSDPAFARDLSEFIYQRVNEQVISGFLGKEALDAMPMPYQYDTDTPTAYQLTPEGVRFLLVHFEYLKRE